MIAVVCGLVILGVIEIFHLAVTTALVRRIRAVQTGTIAAGSNIGGPEVGQRGPKPASLPGVPEGTDILVGFFSPGCPACRDEAPRFAEAVPELGKGGVRPVVVLNGAAGPDRDSLAAALAPAGVPVLDEAARQAFRAFAINGTPAFFLLRADGKVAGKGVTTGHTLIASEPPERAKARA
jgi:thiol-disulfide isomerase/thioredoxin